MEENTKPEEIDVLMQELDREQAYRRLGGIRKIIICVVSVAFCLFQLYATLSGRIPAQILRASHLAFVQFLAFLLFPATKKMSRSTLPWYDVVLGLVGAACWMYIVTNFSALASRAGAYTPVDIAVGTVAILILCESCRRLVGLPILIIACLCRSIYAGLPESPRI